MTALLLAPVPFLSGGSATCPPREGVGERIGKEWVIDKSLLDFSLFTYIFILLRRIYLHTIFQHRFSRCRFFQRRLSGRRLGFFVDSVLRSPYPSPVVPFPCPHDMAGSLQLVDGLTDGVGLLPIDIGQSLQGVVPLFRETKHLRQQALGF